MVRATPAEGRETVARGLSTFPSSRGAPAPKSRGSLSPPASLPYGAPLRRATGGTREAQPRYAIPQPTREIGVVPRLMRRFVEF